jgi:hypothetical protein
VVGVVVVDPDAALGALELHAPAHPGEAAEALDERRGVQPETGAEQQRAGGVQRQVAARDGQGHRRQPASAQDGLVAAGGAADGEVRQAQVGVLGGAVRADVDALLAGPAGEATGAVVVGAQHDEAGGSTVSTNCSKARSTAAAVAVVVEVVGLDVRDDRGVGR